MACLFSAAETGKFELKCGGAPAPLPARFAEDFDAYARRLLGLGLAPGTVAAASYAVKRFLVFADGVAVAGRGLASEDVLAYAAGLSALAPSTRAGHLYRLREFLRFLVAERGADGRLASLFPVIVYDKDLVLPSAFTREETARVVDALRDPSGLCPRRDRAVVLLAVQTGLRGGDINALRLDQVDWRARTASLVQGKTGDRLDIPLPDESFFALADYVKNERPESPDPQVFIRSRAPHTRYAETNHFGYVVERYLAQARVEVGARHHGLHAFRHSLAAGMLTAETPYPVISAVLGHASANTTRRYLRIDIEQLRAMALEVPHAH
ncbi:MAG: tyrosine-type recombinase/integrase [Bifidobacteriaceae bacterium]|nr:tyrosine-type recombinase/integrase [Bifidobacteriaceae bacterium]